MRKTGPVIASMIVLACGANASAQVIWDYGPSTGSYAGNWVNQTQSQNFAEQVIFDQDMFLYGFDLFTTFTDTPGGDYHVKILLDNGAGDPGDLYMAWDQDVTEITTDFTGDVMQFKHSFDFDSVTLAANTTYWIGVSGNGWEVAQSSILTPGDGTMAQFGGDVFSFHTSVGDQMFQLRGEVVPAPGVLGLLGIAGLAAPYRRGRQRR